jgi:hypothetical protein
MKAPSCPKCGKTMRESGKAQSGKQRWRCDGVGEVYCYSTTSPVGTERTKRSQKTPIFKRTLGKTTTRFLVTAAQNATPVHKGFWASLKRAAEHLSAEILVPTIRYKNPTSRWSASQANEEVWADELRPYLYNQRVALHKNLVLVGDVKVQPTASSPLTGFDAITHGESAILAHTKLQLKTVPTPQHSLPKILTTTGACTVPNYTDSKAGALGRFHHTLGATLVETRGKRFHLRQLNAERDGAFQDLSTVYGPEGILEDVPIAGLVLGDTHVDSLDPKVDRATFGMDSVDAVMRPQQIVFHDLLDAYACNPHHRGNPFNSYAKHKAGRNDVQAEVVRAVNYAWARAGKRGVVVSSNHDDMLRRWIVSDDWKSDPVNMPFYLETARRMLEHTKFTPSGMSCPSPFALWAEQYAPNLRVLGGDESFRIAGIECGMHGDRGPNGARGSRMNLRRIGVKSVVGHSHSPGIEEGCYQTGTSTHLRLEYNSGASSWLQAHVAIYLSGKRTLLNIIDGEWRA